VSNIADELADILSCVIRVAEHYSIDLESAHIDARRREMRYLGKVPDFSQSRIVTALQAQHQSPSVICPVLPDGDWPPAHHPVGWIPSRVYRAVAVVRACLLASERRL
jgi:hypothetical protein